MSPEVNTALVVLMVGMITVFIILGLVVLTGHFLIKTVNTFFPAPIIEIAKGSERINQSASSTKKVSKPTVAAIVTAVDLFTSGKGKVNKIEKLD